MTDLAAVENLDFLTSPHLLASKEQRQGLTYDSEWGFYDCSFHDYCVRAPFGGDNFGLLKIIESAIGKDHANVGIDIAGGLDGKAVSDLIKLGLLGKGAVTNLENLCVLGPRDTRLEHIKGNLLEPEAWRRIFEWRRQAAPDGLALVMHRPIGGLQEANPGYYRAATHQILNMIRPGGIMFSQLPRALTDISAKGQLAVIGREITRREDVKQIIFSDLPIKRYRGEWPMPDSHKNFIVIEKAKA